MIFNHIRLVVRTSLFHRENASSILACDNYNQLLYKKYMDSLFLKSFIPETFLSFSILCQLVFNIKLVNKIKLNFPIITREIFIQTLFILISLFLLYNKLEVVELLSNFLLINDVSIVFLKSVLVLISIALMIIFKNAIILQKINFPEYFSIFLLAIFSLLIMLSSENLVSFYLVMEMQALCFYILASFNRNSVFSAEAGLKYFISGSFISGFYLLGCSMIYGCLGTLDLSSINILLFCPFNDSFFFVRNAVLIAFLMIVFTLLFKLACAPFHFWSPDVYEGSPLSSTVIFSILPKISIFYFFIKVLICGNLFYDTISLFLLVFGVFSTFVGTLYALNQNRVKKLIIYSSIAQTGFLVSILSVQTFESVASLYFFLLAYLITSLLVWGYIIAISHSNVLISNFLKIKSKPIYVTDFANLAHINRVFSFSILLIFFSIAGVPPLLGFLSKMNIILQLIDSNSLFAGSLLIVISAVSAYYYIRIIKISFFESGKFRNTNPVQVVFLDKNFNMEYILFSALLFSLVFLFFFPSSLLLLCQYLTINLHLI